MAKILIVEDDPLIARLYQKSLSFEGYNVEVARDGEEGLKKIAENNPPLILLDIMMPKIPGFEVLDRIKSQEETKKIPVIVLTNLASPRDAETALSKGAVKYIVKSEYQPKQIVNMVKEILAGYTREEIPSTAGRK